MALGDIVHGFAVVYDNPTTGKGIRLVETDSIQITTTGTPQYATVDPRKVVPNWDSISCHSLNRTHGLLHPSPATAWSAEMRHWEHNVEGANAGLIEAERGWKRRPQSETDDPVVRAHHGVMVADLQAHKGRMQALSDHCRQKWIEAVEATP